VPLLDTRRDARIVYGEVQPSHRGITAEGTNTINWQID